MSTVRRFLQQRQPEAVGPETFGRKKIERIIGSKLSDEQILERLEISSDMLPYVTEDELTKLAESAKYGSYAIELFVKTRLRFMLREALKEEKGPTGHMEKFLEKEKEVDQQGKLFNLERPNVNNTSVDYLYIASDNTNSDRFHAAGSRRSIINQSVATIILLPMITFCLEIIILIRSPMSPKDLGEPVTSN